MHRILIWTDRHNWLSPDSYPEIHRRFCVSVLNEDRQNSDADGMLVVDGEMLRRRLEPFVGSPNTTVRSLCP